MQNDFVSVICQMFEEEIFARLQGTPGYNEVHQEYMKAVEDAGEIGRNLEELQAQIEGYVNDVAFNEGFKAGLAFAQEYLSGRSFRIRSMN